LDIEIISGILVLFIISDLLFISAGIFKDNIAIDMAAYATEPKDSSGESSGSDNDAGGSSGWDDNWLR
jgi:hypothetical protein